MDSRLHNTHAMHCDLRRAERCKRELNPRRGSRRPFDSRGRPCVVGCKSVCVKARNRQPFWGRAEKNQCRARDRATTARLRFVPARLMIRLLFIRHLAPGHFGAAIGRFRYRDNVRFSHFRAEKGNETDNQQSTQAGSAHDIQA